MYVFFISTYVINIYTHLFRFLLSKGDVGELTGKEWPVPGVEKKGSHHNQGECPNTCSKFARSEPREKGERLGWKVVGAGIKPASTLET